ncbi:MAG: ribonuclease T [Alteromonadaceae bacterium]|nr:MAG: ribonuclease T [Alteromonadaceae bacterium]
MATYFNPVFIVSFILFCFVSTGSYASPPVDEFIATRSCDLYQSKRKQTNPDNLHTQIDRRYPIIEARGNAATKNRWLRVQTSAKRSPARWVSGDCGRENGGAVTPVSNRAACDIAGQFDSNVLAISWQSAFCELYGRGKPECQTLTAERFDAKHFTLHGLWPNRRSCGRNYGSCGKIKVSPRNFCDYPALQLGGAVRKALERVMPSAKAGTCLQRHEWWKHGTCSGMTQSGYYKRSLNLLGEINQSSFVQSFIAAHVGQRVSRQQFQQAFEGSFGGGSYQRLVLRCKSGMLTELQVALPQQIDNGLGLRELLSQPHIASDGLGNCGNYFLIDSV